MGGDFVEVLQWFAAEGEQRAVERLQRCDQFGPVTDLAPVIACLRLPGGAAQGPAGNAGKPCRAGGVGADLCGVRVGSVEQQIDTFIGDELRQTLSAAIAADPNLAAQIARHPANAGEAVDMLWAERAGNRQRFSDTAEQQDPFHAKPPAWPTIPP